MFKCPHCQSEQSSEAEFCTKCGTRLKGLESKDESTKSPDPSFWANPDSSSKLEENHQVPEERPLFESKPVEPVLEEDPFNPNFDTGNREEKKSGDGIWLAIIAIVVVISVIIIGTSRKKTEDKNKEPEKTEAAQEQPVNKEEVKPEEQKTEEKKDEPVVQQTEVKKENYVATASSTQKDISAYNFDYSPKQVLDQDFSTAWIEADKEAGIGEWLEINLSGEKEIDKFGIVPGFAREGSIYRENNRVKSITIEFSNGDPVKKDLEDIYGMQFVEFPMVKTNKVKITINEVYSGTKYNDTCIAEIDFDSDYVKDKNSAAALDFYVKNKKDQAKKPN